MSALGDWLTRKIGPNWKTTITGISNALLSLAGTGAVLAAVLGDKYKVAAAVIAFALAAMSAIAKTLNALVSADAATGASQTESPTGMTTKPPPGGAS